MSPGSALSVYLLLALVVLGLFLGTRASQRAQRQMGAWLGGAPKREDGERPDWAKAFLLWFDELFGVREVRLPILGAWHLPQLRRSILISAVSLVVLATIWVLNKETLSRPLRYECIWNISGLDGREPARLGVSYGGATLVTNWIPDYLSLIESRYVMGRISRTKVPLERFLWLVLDAALTLGIAFAAICGGAFLVLPLIPSNITLEVGCFTASSFTVKDAWTIFLSGLRFQTPPATLNYDAAGIYIYSTFLTSLWVWLFLLSGRLVRVAGSWGRWTPGSERPMPKLSAGALLSLTLTFWPSWALIHEAQVDVHVLHVAKYAAEAEQISAALRAKGFSVSMGAEHNSNAELVVRLLNSAPGAWRAAEQEVNCGKRPRGSTRRFWLDARAPERAVRWAMKAPSLLKRDQLSQCRLLDGLAPLPKSCGP